MKSVTASQLKAKCLAIIDEVAATGEPVVITKRGRPVARLSPAAPTLGRHPQDTLFGTVEVLGDIVRPVLDAEVWEAEEGRLK